MNEVKVWEPSDIADAVLGKVSEAMSDVSYACDTCGFSVGDPLARLSASTLGLFPDRRLPGRCVLVLDGHHEHFEALPDVLAQRFMSDTRRAAQAIREVTGSERLNYAMLGNQVAHLHMHIMPRGGAHDSNPLVSPWELAEPEAALDDTTRTNLSKRILAVLARTR